MNPVTRLNEMFRDRVGLGVDVQAKTEDSLLVNNITSWVCRSHGSVVKV